MPTLAKAVLPPAVLLTLTLAAPLALDSGAQAVPRLAAPCAQWNQFGNWVSSTVPQIRDPANPFFHTREHTAMNADYLLRVGMGFPDESGAYPHSGLYSEALRYVMGQLFAAELQFLAEGNGFRSWQDMVAERGMGALNEIVDFETTTYSTESENYCASAHPITQGTHKGEFLVVARDKSNGRVIGLAIAATEDEAKAIAHDMIEEAEKAREEAEAEGVVAFPDGCGDVRMPPGFGC